jgi:hypothetical protein
MNAAALNAARKRHDAEPARRFCGNAIERVGTGRLLQSPTTPVTPA